jgi:RNA polymerase sigma-70 factor (ECF subfamily)
MAQNLPPQPVKRLPLAQAPEGSGGVREGALEDRELVQGLLKKDAVAERYFYDLYRPKLHKLSTFILGYRDPDVEDAVQETLMAAYANLSGFKFESSFYHWLYRICVFRCHTRLRKRRRNVVGLTDDLEVLARRISMKKADEREQDKEHQMYLEILRDEWKSLDRRCRELLEMRDALGKSYAELAESMKVPLGTVMSRLSRCKEALKALVLRSAKRKGLTDE